MSISIGKLPALFYINLVTDIMRPIGHNTHTNTRYYIKYYIKLLFYDYINVKYIYKYLTGYWNQIIIPYVKYLHGYVIY